MVVKPYLLPGNIILLVYIWLRIYYKLQKKKCCCTNSVARKISDSFGVVIKSILQKLFKTPSFNRGECEQKCVLV